MGEVKKQWVPPRIRQCFVAMGPVLITTSLGMSEGYSSILLPQLAATNFVPTDESTSSWIAAMGALPMPLGCILGGYLMEVIGRKTIHMAACLPCTFGWLAICFAYNLELILFGRFLTGLSVGLLGPPTGVYMSETSEPKFRGFLLAFISFAIAFGIFLSHLLGTFWTWQSTALFSSFFPIICLVFMYFAPESPTFLAKKGKIEEATKAFYWCRGYSEEAQDELDEVIRRQTKISNEPTKSLKETLVDLKKPEFIKPLIILIVFFCTMQWSGNNAMSFYSVSIMRDTIGGNMDEYLSMLIVDTIRLLSSILACWVSKVMGRRPLMIVSGFGTSISLFVLAGFSFTTQFYPEVSTYVAIPLTAMVTYMTFLTVGLVPLPWTMMGEVFPLANRGIGSAISSMVNYGMIFVVVKLTPGMFLNLGTHGTFFTYGICTCLGIILLIFFLPETKDKPLHVIEDHFKSKPKH